MIKPTLTLTPSRIGIIAGAMYGLLFRVIWELESLSHLNGLVTLSFLFLVPFAVGYLRLYCELKQGSSVSSSSAIRLAWQPVLVCLLVTVVTLLEGSICVVLASPAFFFCASMGGLAARWIHLHRKNAPHKPLLSVMLLPIVCTPVELTAFSSSYQYTVTDSILIAATPEQVWREIGNVDVISKQELPWSFGQLIGIPRPLRASMTGLARDAVRTSEWEKGVVFEEVITVWEPAKQMAYQFKIDPERIPDHALDKHVKLGGEIFSPLYGAYTLEPTPEGYTRLTLSTTLEDNTNLGWYSRVWGKVIFHDFHVMLLGLMKQRAEQR
ncbi:hypothetical protein [Alteromonas sp. AMM-1]|uniref:hypothetical protein n=1 Tax=Alteromonas sp. AMM-1 TaxID=3394233 RepID=UPI0039A5D014